MLYTETVEARTLDLIQRLMRDEKLVEFNLVGGTALSLKLGHRKSIDIDLFTGRDFDSGKLSNHLTDYYNAQIHRTIKNGVFGFVDDIKVDLIAHQYPILNAIEISEGIRLYSLEDIGAMKLNAIHQNGTRLKDFVDVSKLLEQIPLKVLTDAFEQKYPSVNRQMAVNGLLYHKDINLREKIDFLGKEPTWKSIAARLLRAVQNPNTVFNHTEHDQSIRQTSARRRGKRPGM